ncbi:MAG: hypothetical protein JWQ38_2526 [Flavipsychrobacter sp.]|nr:hypothetical protein [Flavipsychrobacter sp.]
MTYRYIAAALLLTIAACNKPLPDPKASAFDYRVTGLQDVSVHANDMVSFSTYIHLLSGNPENEPVTMHFEGLPANVSATPDNITFRLNYNLEYKLTAHNATPGVYPVKAVYSSPNKVAKTYGFNLTITPPLDWMPLICSYYYPTQSCEDGIYVSCQIDSVRGQPGKIRIIDRKSPNPSTYGTFDTCYGYVDCCSGTFVIPRQQVQDKIVEGSGSSNGLMGYQGKVELIKTITTATNTYTCSVTLGHQ